jgi:hypothetical protein
MKLLCVPDTHERIPVDGYPLAHERKRFSGQIPFEHIKCLNVNSAHVFAVNGMNMRRVMFALLKVHLDDQTVKTSNNGHKITTFLAPI